MTAKQRWCKILILSVLVLAFPRSPALAERGGLRASVRDFQVQLKVQAITKENFYMGEVWVAPPKFTDVQMGDKYLGDARVVAFDRWGNPVPQDGKWQASDPAMVEVSVDKGHRVKFTVLKAGQSKLRVTIGRTSKQLTINAVGGDGAMRVEILQ